VVEALTRWIRPSPVERDASSSDPALCHERTVMNSLVNQVIRARKAQGPEAIAARRPVELHADRRGSAVGRTSPRRQDPA
jgi:hypothetical protein